MTGALFDIAPTTPKWEELADLHGIECTLREPDHLPPAWVAEYWDEKDQAETKREAIITIIHRLQLAGWETISI